MKANLIYVKGHDQSEAQAQIAIESLNLFNWDVELISGIIPDTLNESDFPYDNLNDSRFADFAKEGGRKYYVKKSCLFNNLKFAERVIEADEPMIFLEHDVLAINSLPDLDFDEYCFLSYQYAFMAPSSLNKPPYNKYFIYGKPGINEFPLDYPLKYYHNSIYKGAIQTPGTAAYALSPKGAEKILMAASKGLEQSDYIINSMNLRLQYLWPSPIKYQPTNLNLSHKL